MKWFLPVTIAVLTVLANGDLTARDNSTPCRARTLDLRALAVVGSDLFITWRGTDSNHRINGMSADISNSANPLGPFTNQVIYGDQASGALSMCTFEGQAFIAWAGTDPAQTLNIMPLPPYIGYGFI
jgi:hypothetical protein